MRKDMLADEPVSRILSTACPLHRLSSEPFRPTRRGDHSSRSGIAPGLEQPTRGSRRAALGSHALAGRASPSPPIWPCSTRGLPCTRHCCRAGGLLPHLFTLAKCARPKKAGSRFCRKPAAEARASPVVYFLWHFPWPSQDPEKLPMAASKGAPRQPPGVTRRVAQSRALSSAQFQSPDFPPVPISRNRRSPG
jgi:hypothetical protein